MAGISSKAAGGIQNKEKAFQGQRFDDELGLNWVQFKWRNHDPQIGRFIEIDPLSSEYVYYSTYSFSGNKVISHVELEGLEEAWFDRREQIDVAKWGRGEITTDEMVANRNDRANAGMKGVELALAQSGVAGIVWLYRAYQAYKILKELKNKENKSKESGETKTHGNKLDDKPAEMYTLRDNKTDQTQKFGETTRGERRFGKDKQKRYTKKELERTNSRYQKEAEGTKKDMHKLQHERIKEYRSEHGERPPLNKSDY